MVPLKGAVSASSVNAGGPVALRLKPDARKIGLLSGHCLINRTETRQRNEFLLRKVNV
ncbi:hypothetical protein HanRHA438_Chr13g0579731 [Helianthus annuus]|nr:hypothetical protein HanIR_Chr13g0619071 [Helianthus annuus]KAJ0856555.1 hypothetical protein HanRHA438_Chr13g0579731 [Helianthus annuus]